MRPRLGGTGSSLRYSYLFSIIASNTSSALTSNTTGGDGFDRASIAVSFATAAVSIV